MSPHALTRALTTALIAGAALVAIAVPSASATGGPFACDVATTFIAQGPNTSLSALTYGTSGGSFAPIGGPAGFQYNGIAYNPNDHYIYGVNVNSTQLYRIDDAGTMSLVMTTGFFFPNVGAIDAATNTMYVMNSGNGAIGKINLTTMAESVLALSEYPYISDFTFVDGQIWGQSNQGFQSLVRIDPATGHVDRFAAPMLPASYGAGAAWTYGNGNLGLSDNGSGTILQIKIDGASTATPTFAIVSSQPGPGSQNNDGTHCPGLGSDLSVTKAAPAYVDAGEQTTWTLTVHNGGPGTSSAHVVTDDVPAAVTNLHTTTPGCTFTGHRLQCVHGPLAAGADTVVTFTGDAPLDAGATVVNTASVLGNDADPDPSNDEDSATTHVGAEPADLSIVKTADPAEVHPGDTVTYHLTAHNDGGGAAADVELTDTIPAGLTVTSVPAGCTLTAGTLHCPLGTLAPGETRTVTLQATADAVSLPAAHDHLLTASKVEAQIDLDAGQTSALDLVCPSGARMTDGSVRADEVDQGTGTLADVHVLRSESTGLDRYSFRVENTGTGRAQAKAFGVCLASPTGTSLGHAHDLIVSAPATTTATVNPGRTTLHVSCGAGQVAVAPGFAIGAGFARLAASEPDGTGRAFTIESALGAVVTVSARCLDRTTGETDGHVHALRLGEIDRDVTVPAHATATERVVCPDDAKGIVASFDVPEGMLAVGNDPQPKSRDFRLVNTTGAPLAAHLDLLCVGDRTGGPAVLERLTNSAMVSSTTPDPDADDLVSGATVLLTAGDLAPIDVPAPTPHAFAATTSAPASSGPVAAAPSARRPAAPAAAARVAAVPKAASVSVRGTAVRVTLTTTGAASGTVRLVVGRTTVATASYHRTKAGRSVLTLRLTKQGRKLLHRKGAARKATLVVRTAGGRMRTTTVRLPRG